MYDGCTWEVCSFLTEGLWIWKKWEMRGDETVGKGEKENFDLVYYMKKIKMLKIK